MNKHHHLIIIGLLLAATTLLSFGILTTNDDKPMKNDYETQWKQFKEHLSNSLPESAEKVLNDIEMMAVRDNNQVQLLKTILYRYKVMHETIEEAPEEAYLKYTLAQFDRLDVVPQAVLHCEIAKFYSDYYNEHQYDISQNIAIDGDLDNVAMKYWDKRTFQRLIDEHYALALQPIDQLKATDSKDYMCLYESLHPDHLEYEPTMFDYLFHRVAKHYMEVSSADDIQPEWNTQLWWLDDMEFAKADLGDSDNAIIRCLRFYQQLIANNKGNEDLVLYNDYKRLNFVNGILKEYEPYQKALRSLMARHRNNPQFADLSNCLATSLINQYQASPDDSTYYNNYHEAAEICQQAINAYPQDAQYCKNTLSYLKSPYVEFTLNEVQLPNENIPVIMEFRNVEHPYYKIIKVTESELKKLEKLYNKELKEALLKKSAYKEGVIDIPAETDYLTHSAIAALPPLKEGIYYVLGNTSKENTNLDQIFALNFQVSNLSFITDSKPNQFEIVTLDRKTGHPLQDVTIEVFRSTWNYTRREYEIITVANLKSDANGRAVLTNTAGHDSFQINLKKGNDVLLANNYYNVEREPSKTRPTDNTTLFTDRAIYRPGQTVYFKGIVVHEDNGVKTLATNFREEISMKDANWQHVALNYFTTDEYGSFSGSFVIPTDLLNGTFHLTANHGSTTFRVEEYKRPTFKISFESIKEQYKLNQDVTVRGSVDALAGFGLDDVKYSYRVVRKTSFPWRCWWWWYPAVEDEQIDYGEARTDESGKFTITFNLKPSLKTKPEQQPVFTYEIVVTATSAQGETHSSTHYIRAGYNEVAITTSIPSLVEQSDLSKHTIEVCNMNGNSAKSRVARKIYRLDDETKINFFEAFDSDAKIDRILFNNNELDHLFPAYSFTTQADQLKHKTLVYEDIVNIDGEIPCYPGRKTLQPGKYYIELKSLDDPLAQAADEFTVYAKNAQQPPTTTIAWLQADKGSAKPGETVHFNIGSSARDVKMWVKLKHGDEVRLEQWITLNGDIQQISYTVTEADRGGLRLITAFVYENSYQINSESVSVPYDNLDLDVTLATLRDKLNPGGEETWTVKVKDNKGKPVQSALMAGMYDAALDDFVYHSWSFNMRPGSVWGKSFRGDDYQFTSSASTHYYFSAIALFNFDLPSDYPFFYIYSYRYGRYQKNGRGRVVYEDGMVGEPLMDMVECVNYEAPMVAKAAGMEVDEEAMDDVAEAGGASPQSDAEPALRENFNETAFFFPDLRTEADGSSTFTFTMPDAITRWKLMMIAYTKNNQTGRNEYSFTSSKPVMIMADMPRYMYDTDTLWFVANVINTGEEAVTPKAKLEIFDAASMKPLKLLLSDAVLPMKTIAPGRSQEVRWKVAAKYDLGLLAFRFTAYAGQFSDAEQHLLPVLSSEVFLTQTLPITVKAETEKTFDFDAIANPDSHERDYNLTLNFSTNPVWYAVQSLPYLANVKTDRPENAFYVFYANSLSAYIADHVPNLMAYIKKWQIETPDALLSQLEKDQDLKAIMLQETPWVLEAKSETEQRSRIANLFELNTLRQQQTATLNLLKNKQKYNGGWPWVDGMPESAYITTYILSGMGRLKQMGVWESMSQADQQKAEEICENAVRFIESDVAKTYREMKRLNMEWGIGSFTLHELYALSFFPEQNSDSDYAKAKAYFLDRLDEKREWTSFDFNQRSFAALVLYRLGDKNTAKLIIQSFKECAQKNEEIGMYWPKHYFSFISHVGTHANIMAAFAEIDQDQEMLDQLRVWLLTQKRTNMWENSSSTADAIYALLLRGSDWFEEGKNVTLSFGGTAISTEGGEAGTGFIQRRWNANEVTEDMRHLTVDNPTGHLVWGGLFRQYFVPIDEVKSDESGFKVKRELFVETVTDNGKLLVPVGKQTLKVGDKLTVKITIESSQDMSFVFVKDLRAAGFEPLEQISRYEYDDHIGYYQSNTDTDMEFFIDFLPKGTHQLEYSMFVTKEGNLSNGYALVQCQYAPEFTAYSDGMRVRVESEK